MLENVDVITLWLDVETELGSLDGFFIILLMASLRDYCLDTHWDLLMGK